MNLMHFGIYFSMTLSQFCMLVVTVTILSIMNEDM